MAVLETDLRALSVEARRKFPAVKDAAEHAILKVYPDLLCQIHPFLSDLVVFISPVDSIGTGLSFVFFFFFPGRRLY